MLKPNKDRSNRLILVLWVYTALELLTSISDILQYLLLKRIETGNFEMGEVNANDTRQQFIAIAMFLIYIGVAIVFIQWFRRAYYNLHQLSNSLSHSEGWAAGAWFVPFINLVRPFNIMKEMMYISEHILVRANLVQEDRNRERSVGIWWTLWIIVSILSNINAQIQSKSSSITVLKSSTLTDVILAFLCIPLTIFTVRMIKNYAELETYLPQIDVNNKTREIKIDDSDILDSI
ncbi:DUF4328 domain-containing protein [Fluviicola sp.]|jgi:hypothetical protein|uniref:DUF4328 domain-containing protein n=1 Tax=Fluviicola sp. TaxID=1917219 RepID=UPI002820AA15|nr:DUF4328 domain-containing protein [Fluviicola sp.]MDR0801655.1 DUF4328 domain-containing protein [Fluviicola sp.]